MLRIITVILSRLLLVGVFGSGMDAEEDTLAISGARTDAEQDETHVDALP